MLGSEAARDPNATPQPSRAEAGQRAALHQPSCLFSSVSAAQKEQQLHIQITEKTAFQKVCLCDANAETIRTSSFLKAEKHLKWIKCHFF